MHVVLFYGLRSTGYADPARMVYGMPTWRVSNLKEGWVVEVGVKIEMLKTFSMATAV